MSDSPTHKDTERLIDMGRARGYITYDEFNEMLPADAISDVTIAIEEFIDLLKQENIQIVDSK